MVAELGIPDLDLIKQVQQGTGMGAFLAPNRPF
jgi:hypothetical protein